MPPDPVSWADVERIISERIDALRELISEEHKITSGKLEGLRAEGRMREDSNRRALSQTEVNIRAYVDEIHKEIKQGVENETTCLQAGLDRMHDSIFGNGKMDESIAYRLKVSETSQAHWEKIASRLFWGIGIPLSLGILGALWMFVSGQWELMVH